MKKYSMGLIPAAAVMTVALLFGVQAQAQTTTPPPGSTNKLDAPAPEPMGGKAKSVEERSSARMVKDEKNPAKAAKRAKRKPAADDTNLTKPGSVN